MQFTDNHARPGNGWIAQQRKLITLDVDLQHVAIVPTQMVEYLG